MMFAPPQPVWRPPMQPPIGTWQHSPAGWCPPSGAVLPRDSFRSGPAARPVYPSPDTPQYLGRRDPPTQLFPPPSEAVKAEGWVHTSLRSMVERDRETFADKYLVGESDQQYFSRTSGWELEFWNSNTDKASVMRGMVHPVGCIDLRMVVRVEAYKVPGGLHEISLKMRGGSFFFRVQKAEDAAMWSGCISQAIVERTHAERMHQQAGVDRAHSLHTHVVQPKRGGPGGAELKRGKDQMEHYVVSPKREAALRRIWAKCLRAAAGGRSAPAEAFSEMFMLYDFDADHNLDQDECEVMLRELILVRLKELKEALQAQREHVMTPQRIKLDPDGLRMWQRTVGDPGNKLVQHYDRLLEHQGFESRAILLRSKLDTTPDGQVTHGEFVRSAPAFLLPQRELLLEAQFYKSCGTAKEHFQFGDKDEEAAEEAGCLHQ